MLERRPNCENCNKDLAQDNTEAMICAFECTFCQDCVEKVLHNVCPNCGGGFEKRPIMPKEYRKKYPPTSKVIFKPVDLEVFQETLKRYQEIEAHKR